MRLRVALLSLVGFALGCAGLWVEPDPEITIDPARLIVVVESIVVNLESECGIEQSLLRRDFDVLIQRADGYVWKVRVYLNQIPALVVDLDSGEWECGIASKAYGRAS